MCVSTPAAHYDRLIHSICCTQAERTDADRVNKLLDILLRQDDRLLPRFCDVLRDDRQPHVVDILRRNGLPYKYYI